MTKLLVMGLGYVGMPLARQAVAAGMDVTGCDISESRVRMLNAGQSPIDDLTDDNIVEMLAAGFLATTPGSISQRPDVMVICVPTPLSETDGPDLAAVIAAAKTAGRLLKPGALVVLESTTYPGTTDDVVRPILEKASGRPRDAFRTRRRLSAGVDFYLAFSPERIDPGNPSYGFSNTPKVVGGITPACTEAAMAFYTQICKEVVVARSAREAEMAKLLENTYRHVNIALVNEMAIFCHEMGIDLWDAIRCASTKPFGFQPFYPGAGVGGHCIPIDPNYLSHEVKRTLGYPFRFVELAQEINNRMPAYVVTRAAELLNQDTKPLNGSTVLLLGVTYKPDIKDQRESPAPHVARRLIAQGACVRFHDPLVEEWIVDGEKITRWQGNPVDLAILLQAHSAYSDLTEIVSQASILLDTTGRAARLPRVSVLL
ncbi:MAG TPA: nucleotide sugar dehydrogenase [Streptosporangiaceae bacterium]|nr:nucleotide sugar dehydrogenase [Streptosporangiaceae bacterium]